MWLQSFTKFSATSKTNAIKMNKSLYNNKTLILLVQPALQFNEGGQDQVWMLPRILLKL